MTSLKATDLGLMRGERWVIRNASFEVPRSAFVAVLGPNGVGKTSLILAAMGLLSPSEGTIEVLGAAPESLGPTDIGYVPQVRDLDRSFPALARELVETGLSHSWPGLRKNAGRDRVIDAMNAAGVAELSERPIGALSGGELQRVYLARCFVRSPRLMLLDEPASGMDIAGEAAMYHLIENYQEEHKATVLMVTHDWEGARLHASHVLILAPGRCLFAKPDEVALEEELLNLFGHRGHARETHAGHNHA